MVALDVEHALHALGVGEGRRVEEDEIVALARAGIIAQPFQTVGLDEFVRPGEA